MGFRNTETIHCQLFSETAKMEWTEEVNIALGAENVGLLIKEVQDGEIKKEQVKQIALQMHAKANGVFEEKQRTLELSNVMLHILDCWYN